MALRRGVMPGMLGRIIITAGLVWLALWMLKWGLESRVVASGSYDEWEMEALAPFPRALVRRGAEAWAEQDVPGAIRFFKEAAGRDPLNLGAWLRLAEAEKAAGNRKEARKILEYTHRLGQRTLRWTWTETLLAVELEAYERAWENLNRLIQNHRHTPNALQLVDVLLALEPGAVAARLKAQNLGAYLAWLTGWGRLDEALMVQGEMARMGRRDPELDETLCERLLARKRVPEALTLAPGRTRPGRIMNPGFEEEITHRGFDWRFSNGLDRGRRIRRVEGAAREGRHCLEVTFSGEKNGAFDLLRQIVPVRPGASYRLTAWWKGKGISTDQGPFLEVYGYDGDGLRVKGPMLLGTRDWEKVSLDFAAPEGCHAVVIRLRRVPSRKLDNRIAGRIWLDGFSIREPGDGSRESADSDG